jgi:hypothetical protein
MAQSQYERNVGFMILAGCLIVGGGILVYVVWDALSDEEVGIESVPTALWMSGIALLVMALIYGVVCIRERASRNRQSSDYWNR